MDEHTGALARIAEIATGAGDARADIEKIAGEVANLFDTAMASVFLYSDEGVLKHASGSGIPPHFIRKLEESGGGRWAEALLSRGPRPTVLEKAQTTAPAEEICAWARSIGIESMALAPLVSEGKALGMLVLYHHSTRAYTEQEYDTLHALAALTTMSVIRAHFMGGGSNASDKSQLFSVLSHELRTPLTSIMGFTQIIRKRLTASGNSDARLLEQLDVLWAQAQRLNRLIDTFVDMSRIERGEFQITRGQVDLTSLLRAASTQAAAQASSRHKVDVNAPSTPLWLHGDNKRLEQVFSHVISNALRYSPQEQPVLVTCEDHQADGNVLIRVVDRGPGIPASRLKEIFDRSYPSGPLKAGGLGVGLYLSKVIVEAHGGQISIDSTPTRGTTVSILLPV